MIIKEISKSLLPSAWDRVNASKEGCPVVKEKEIRDLSRKKYYSPQLVEYGNAMKLVRGSDTSGSSDDGNTPNSYYNS